MNSKNQPESKNLRHSVLALLLLWPSNQIHFHQWSHFILWNVGQGQWATLSTPTQCLHFDMGGEFANWPQIQRECLGKQNTLFISHGDWDHISFVRQAQKRFPGLCLHNNPPLRRSLQKKILSQLPKCPRPLSPPLFHFHPSALQEKSNDNSHVFGLSHFLIPGDSTKKMERQWAPLLREAQTPYRVLILGHHGSHTSTSTKLLQRLPHLKQALASSRKAKYGHPHSSVRNRLTEMGVPLLSTDNWGTIRMRVQE